MTARRLGLRRWMAVVGAWTAAHAVACTTVHTVEEPPERRPPRDGGAAPDAPDGQAGRDGGEPTEGKCRVGSAVDLLFVIDNSNSMAEEQASFSAALPRFIELLTTPPDRDADREPDWLAVTDLRVGVVSTDMGTGGFAVPTCPNAAFGDDAILSTRGNTARPGCATSYPPFLSFGGGAMPIEDLACVTELGTGGCGFEQHLEAALKAVTPSTFGVRFAFDSLGHGDRANAGFLRPESLVAVVIVSDEDDCSFADAELANPRSTEYTADLNLRCFAYPNAAHPIDRFSEGLRGLRPAREDMLAVAIIAGVPPDLTSDPARVDFARVLADPRMQERLDPGTPTRLVPSCNAPGMGIAFPPRRLVRFAQAFEGQAVLQSICQPDVAAGVQAFAETVGRRACLSRDP